MIGRARWSPQQQAALRNMAALFTAREGQGHTGCWHGQGKGPGEEGERWLQTECDKIELFLLGELEPMRT